MTRRAFFSFHFANDAWRASQVRNMGVLEGNTPVSDNDWEAVKKGGDKQIEKWIDGQLYGKSCTVVLIGASSSERKLIIHEIVKSWDLGKGVVGIDIHNLLNKDGKNSTRGANPFDKITIGGTTSKLSSVVKRYNPPYTTSTDVYNHIRNNIDTWVEEAIRIRGQN